MENKANFRELIKVVLKLMTWHLNHIFKTQMKIAIYIYIGKTTQNQLITIIPGSIFQTILECVNERPFYSVMFDEMAYISQLVIVISIY